MALNAISAQSSNTDWLTGSVASVFARSEVQCGDVKTDVGSSAYLDAWCTLGYFEALG